MKPILLAVCLWFAQVSLTHAEAPIPLGTCLNSTEYVCLARVTAVEGYKITFTVTEALRGHPDRIIKVNRAGGAENYTLNSEWLLVSCSYGLENSVGWDEDRPASWVPGAIIRNGDKIYVTDWTSRIPPSDGQLFGITWDKTPNGIRCLTLDHIKQILKEHPYKS